jgi:hypothetical protein
MDFMEYCIHSFIFHMKSKKVIIRKFVESFHMYHHRNPEDQRVFTSGLTPAIFWTLSVSSILTAFVWELGIH